MATAALAVAEGNIAMGRYARLMQWADRMPVGGAAMHAVLRGLVALRFQLRAGREEKEQWRRRTEDVLHCPDNAAIPRVADAGKVRGAYQVMHNGIRIRTGSYYGYPVTRMLKLNRGVHEPEEERAFGEVLRHIPAGGVMVELGAYWGFYSMWFHKVVPGARCYLVEPQAEALESGQGNFRANGMTAHFTRAFAGAASGVGEGGVPVICIDDFMRTNALDRIDLLHADIQGAELDMLHGASGAITSGRIDYVFISTHATELHTQCSAWLVDKGFEVLASADQDETYSYDGLLVARRGGLAGAGPISISRKCREAGLGKAGGCG